MKDSEQSPELRAYLETSDAFLRHFPPRRRGVVANHFLNPIRDYNHLSPEEVVHWVIRKRPHETGAVASDHYEEALNYAKNRLAWERLTKAEKLHVRGTNADGGGSSDDPPTEKQIAFAKDLGITKIPDTKGEIGRLIGEAVAERRRHDRHRDFG